MGEFKNRLKKMQEAWEEGKEGAAQVPEAIYTMQLQSANLQEAISSGKLMIHREHLIVEGEQQGEVVHDYMHLETELGPRFITRWVEQMGYEAPDDAADLEDVVAAIVDDAPMYLAQVKHSGDFTNVRVRELIEGEVETAEDEEEEEEAEGEEEEEAEAEEGEEEEEGEDEEEEEGEEEEAEAEEGEEGELSVGDGVSFTDEEDNAVTGIVEAIVDDEDEIQIKDEDGNVWQVPSEDVEAVSDEDAGGEEEGADLDELLAFAQAQDIDVDDNDDVETVAGKINEYAYKAEELTPDEAELLTSIGAQVEEEAPKKKKAKSKPKAKPKKAKPKKGKGKGKKKKASVKRQKPSTKKAGKPKKVTKKSTKKGKKKASKR